MEELWDKFKMSGLITGAWSGLDWIDIPKDVQDEFIEIFGEKNEHTTDNGRIS